MLYQLRKRLTGHPGNIQTHEGTARKRFLNIFDDIFDDGNDILRRFHYFLIKPSHIFFADSSRKRVVDHPEMLPHQTSTRKISVQQLAIWACRKILTGKGSV